MVGIMVSDSIDQFSGFLYLTDREHERVKQSDPDFPKEAHVRLEYGGEWEGYWTGERFMKNVQEAAEFKYNKATHTV